MPNVPNERSSDLEAARAASRSLRTGATQAVLDRGYVRFEASRFTGARATEALSRTPRAPEPRFGSASWERLLDDCMVAAESSDAFLINEQGLVIALRGAIDPDEAESVGSRTQLAMEQVDRMANANATRRMAMVELDSRWLVGVRFALGDGTSVTLCLLCREPPEADGRRKLTTLLDDAAARTDEPKTAAAQAPLAV